MTLSIPKRVRALGLAAVFAVPALTLGGCTDLSVDPFSSVAPENFYQTDAEVVAALAPVYAQLRASLWAYHNLSQVTSDENIVPTRGSDWADGGRWLDMHRHTWSPGMVDLNDAWVAAYTGVARANGLLRDLGDLDVPNKDALVAEIRALRAFYYYQVLDLFGNVPLVGDEEGEFLVDGENPQGTETRADVFAFVESELLEARADLPVTQGQFGRMTQDAADAILANLYINAEVFTGTVTASGLQPGTARWQDAYDVADRLISSGRFELVDDWRSNFAVENENHPEHIFVVQHIAEEGLGLTIPMRMTHYNQFSPSPWNGFATLAETYQQFDEGDARREIFLEGQAQNFETGEFDVENRSGDPLIFTLDFPGGVENTTEGGGVRLLKYEVDVDHVNGNNANDYAFFRLGEMYLIRAEAAYRLNRTDDALADLNTLRDRVFADDDEDAELTSLDDATILRERLFELAGEAKRRQDLVRFGQFTNAWSFKNASEPYRILFPIPQQQRDANPNLAQNAGY